MQLILASSSFLRKFIMDQSKLSYSSVSPDIDEYQFDDHSLEERVQMIAEAKCNTLVPKYPQAFIIAADTLTATEDKSIIYDKRHHKANSAIEQSLELSGKTIMIATGITIHHPSIGTHTELSLSRITYQKFSKHRLEVLLESDSPERRSGALGMFYDSPGFTLIKRIDGSYTGAMGLPMEIVYSYLDKINKHV